MRTHTLRRAISIALFATAVGTASLAVARSSDRRDTAIPNEARDAQQFELAPGALASSLDAVGAQSGRHITYSPELVANRQGRAVQGRMHWRDAIAMLLQGSGLEHLEGEDGTVVIEPAHADADRRVSPEPVAARTPQGAAATDLETITVTGTRIRGGTTPSPVITFGSERIREEGFSDMGEVIRSVPQNFSGGQNPGVAAGATAGAGGVSNQNVTGGSSLNLRGLGADATLTLLNGRRLSYGGFAQAVDISAIPVEAVDRVEIVADGASAIYGSDAVGGVGNVILKRDYEGAAVGVQYGRSSDGGLSSRGYTATAGSAWQSGGLIATYKYASSDPILASQRSYTAHMPVPTTIYPGSHLRSGLVSGYQSLGDSLELRVDALRTEREQRSTAYFSGISSYYSRFSPVTRSTLVAPSLEFAFGDDWRLAIGATWGRDRRVQQEWMTMVATGEVRPSPYDDCYCNDSRAYEAGVEGPLFNLPAGTARIAVGLGQRDNGFVQRSIVTAERLIEGDERSRFAYAELSVPLMSAQPDVGGAERLSLTAAVRREEYDSFGGVATPKLGLVYRPGQDYTLKASWGRSFKAPTLLQRYQAQNALLYPAAVFGGSPDVDGAVLAVFGGNAQLDAERARTSTVSLALHPRRLPGFEAELSVFDIDYTDRVVQPIGNYAEALTNPIYAPFIDRSPTADGQARIIDSAAGFYNYTGGDYDPADVTALLYARFVNVARERIKGVDLSASYRFDLGLGRLTVRGSSSWLDSTREISPTDAAFDLAGTLYSPAKTNSRAGAVWQNSGFGASLFANYSSGVISTVSGVRTASFTTADLTLRYAFDSADKPMPGWDVSISTQNLFNRAPPWHQVADPTWVPYDSTNYSGVGRLFDLSITRRF